MTGIGPTVLISVIGAVEAALFALGVALLINAGANWGRLNVLYITLVVMIGAAAGWLIGYVFGRDIRRPPWLVLAGQLIAAAIAIPLMLGLFLVSSQPVHWRLFVAGAILCSYTGALAGLGAMLLAGRAGSQPTGQLNRESVGAATAAWTALGRAAATAEPPMTARPSSDATRRVEVGASPPSVPGPMQQPTDRAELVRRVEAELGALPPHLRAAARVAVGEQANEAYVTIPLVDAGGIRYTLYLVCTAHYPDEAPALVLSRPDVSSKGDVQVDFQSTTLAQWSPRRGLAAVVVEVETALRSRAVQAGGSGARAGRER